ncbi:MAG TPA: cytochrome c [Luteimonas sp.]|nr:cytochrome c [Luteimonas sp.]
MPIVTRHSMITVAILTLASLVIIGGFVWSGIYNIGADDTHTRPVYSMLQMMRERSISARASKLHPPPNLNDPALIRQGAGNYNSMCTGCHLGPGMEPTELSKGLYPAPPNFSKVGVLDPSHHFWVIKHGIKASGMPAWGKSMSDEYIWGMVAFLQQLPKLNAEQYKAMVASSGGHSHGGGESSSNHDEGEADHHDMAGMDTESGGEAAGHDHGDAAATEGVMHTHADGTREMHPATKAATKPAAVKPTTKTPATPPATDEHAGMAMPETPPAEHADDGHQH